MTAQLTAQRRRTLRHLSWARIKAPGDDKCLVGLAEDGLVASVRLWSPTGEDVREWRITSAGVYALGEYLPDEAAEAA